MAMQSQAMQAQVNAQSQEMAAQMAMQKQQAEIQGKMQLKQAETSFEIEKMKIEAALKAQLMNQEFNLNMQLKGMDMSALEKRETQKEKAKNDRISLQNTQQSKLINQRKNDLPPVTFESNEDSLDGFDLAQFNPR